jgi:hypothetical protein
MYVTALPTCVINVSLLTAHRVCACVRASVCVCVCVCVCVSDSGTNLVLISTYMTSQVWETT